MVKKAKVNEYHEIKDIEQPGMCVNVFFWVADIVSDGTAGLVLHGIKIF